MEQASLIAWLERRLTWADRHTLPIYIQQFKYMWYELYGTYDGIPQELKDRTTALYEQLKGEKSDDQA